MRSKIKFLLIFTVILFGLLTIGQMVRASEDWDVLYTAHLNSILNQPVQPDAYGLFYYDGEMFVSSASVGYPHSMYNEKGKLFRLKYENDAWVFDDSFVIPGIEAGTMNFSSFEIVDDYLYAVNRSNTVYKIELSSMTVASSFTTDYSQIITIAYDKEQDAFWISDYTNSSRVHLVSKTGQTISSEPLIAQNNSTNVAITGLAYDDVSEGGPYLLAGCGNLAWTNMAVISRWNLSTGIYEHNIQNVNDIPGATPSGNYMGSIFLYSDYSLGKAVLAGISKQVNIMFGYDFGILADPLAPGKVENFSLNAGANGLLEAHLSWTNPSQTVSGEELTELLGVKILRDGELVHTISSPAMGSLSSWTDESVEQGMVTYKIVPFNTVGDGVSVSARTFIGPDLPSAVSNLVLDKDGTTGLLTWEEPESGINSGWINTATLAYDIVRFPDEVMVASDVTGTSYTDSSIEELANYNYKVISKNDAGEGGFALSNQMVIGSALNIPYMMDFDGQTSMDLWTIINANEDNVTWVWSSYSGNTTPGCVKYGYHATNAGDDWLISPPLKFEADKRYSVKWSAKAQSSNFIEKYKVYSGTSSAVSDQGLELGEYQTQNYQYEDYFILIPSQPQGGEFYLSWYANSDANASGLFLDDIYIEEVVDVDVEALAILGIKSLSVGTEYTHRVLIRNNGVQTASGFDVTLKDEFGNTLGSKAFTENLEINQTAEVEINWVPDVEGAYTIEATVSIENDQVSDNDKVEFEVKVRPFGSHDIMIGEPTATSINTPLYLTYAHSASQTLYYEDEINTMGRIDTISYFNSFSNALSDRHIRIYMTTTDKEQFEAGAWITSATLVYDGNVDFPQGSNSIPIALDKPFHYTGGNLMVMCIAPTSTNTSMSSYFWNSASTKPNRSIYRFTVGTPFFSYNADSTAFVFDNPGIVGSPNTNFPVISLLMNSEVGIVKGVVTDEISPLKDAKVELDGTDYMATTNAQGEFEMTGVPVGTYTLKVSKDGYADVIEEGVEVNKGLETVLEYTLHSLERVTVEGIVVDPDDNPIEGASIMISGYRTYKTITNEDGVFTVNDVYASRIYDLQVNAGGYISVVEEIIVGNQDEELDAIVLQTCSSNAPTALVVEVNTPEWYDVTLSWVSPELEGMDLLGYNIYSNGIIVNSIPIEETSFVYTTTAGNYIMEVSTILENGCESPRIGETIVVEPNPCDVGIIDYPYAEGFEENFPTCWHNEFVFGDEPWAVVKAEEGNNVLPAYKGDYSIRFYLSGTNQSTKLVTPMFDLTGLDAPTLTFYHLMPSTSEIHSDLNVYYKNSEDADWVLIEEFHDEVTEWKLQVVDLPEPTETYWLAFEGVSHKWGLGIYLDEMMIVNDICLPITELNIEQVLENSVKLSWPVPQATRISGYKIIRNGEVQNENVESNLFIDANVPVGDHTYEVIVNYNKPYCTESVAVEKDITTNEMCDPISNLEFVVLDNSSVMLTWDEPQAVKLSSYTVKRGGVTLTTTLTEPAFTDTGLAEGRYTYSIYANYIDKEGCTISAPVSRSVIVKCTEVSNFVAEVAIGRVVRLSWNLYVEGLGENPNIASFELKRDDAIINVIRDYNYNDVDVTPGAEHVYTVTPIYDNGCTGESVEVEAFIYCNAPHNLEVEMIDNGETCIAELTWGVLPDIIPSKNTENNVDEVNLDFQTQNKSFMDSYIGTPSLDFADENRVNNQVSYNLKSANALFDNGPFVTHTGVGYNGADISTMIVEGNYTRGWKIEWSPFSPITIADDFELLEESHIEEIDFFAYVNPQYTLSSHFVALFVVLYDKDPSKGGRVIWGSLNDDVMIESVFSGVYRVDPEEDLFTDNSRPIMRLTAGIDIILPAGNYWLEMTTYAVGHMLTGPWAIPVTIEGEVDTGNALHFYNGEWGPMQHGNGGGFAGLPFTIFGEQINRPANVYCDGELVASMVEGNSVTIYDVPQGKHEWEVRYICGDQESEGIFATGDCGTTRVIDTPLSGVNAYPNPVDGMLQISNNALFNTIRITDMNGRVLFIEDNLNTTEWQIDMSNFQSGIYILSVDKTQIKLIKN